MTNIVQQLHDWVDAIERLLHRPEDSTQLEHWLDSAEHLADIYLDTKNAEHQARMFQIMDIYESKFRESLNCSADGEEIDAALLAKLDDICNRPQIEQRTPAWYEHMSKILSASELDDIFGPPRTRAQLVMSKVNPVPRPPQPLAVQSSAMSAFDWGIRFEPVVKQIYTHKYNATIKELGRLTALSGHRLSASPDGLVYSGKRAGRLIEIKCPVTREPDGLVPKKYYNQMQAQLHVTDLDTCDYVEAVFISPYSSALGREGPSHYYGEILLIYAEDTGICRYEYGPINPEEDFTVPLLDTEQIIERIPWRLYSWHEQVVKVNPSWWPSLEPIFNVFWEDVERARQGNFIVPEARPRKKKDDLCLIVIKEDRQQDASPCPTSEGARLII